MPRLYLSLYSISGLGSVVIPVTLEENVLELHQFLYVDKEEAGEDEEGYEPSEEVMRVNNKIESLVGPRTAMIEEKKEEPHYQDRRLYPLSSQMENRLIQTTCNLQSILHMIKSL